MTTYLYTPQGLQNKATGEIEPFRYDARPVLPRIDTSDDHEPILSMADGQVYTSKAKMRESYRARNNPQGIEYAEVGTDQSHKKAPPRKKIDPDAIKSSVERAVADLEKGKFDG